MYTMKVGIIGAGAIANYILEKEKDHTYEVTSILVRDMEKYREIEKSIIKKYRKDIWSKFVKAVKDYELINENDKVAVCMSGGKDYFLLAKCLEELQRHGIFKFDLEFIIMNPGYNDEILNKNL